LPNLDRCRIIHQFFVARNGLPSDGVDHGIGVVFKVQMEFMLHQLCWYVYRVERGLLFQGEYIYCMPHDIASSCSAGDGHLGRCLLAVWLDLCGRRSLLACTWGRLHHEWDRAIEQSFREAQYSFEGLDRWCIHRWYQINHHGKRDCCCVMHMYSLLVVFNTILPLDSESA
jgi:hypothetical protein